MVLRNIVKSLKSEGVSPNCPLRTQVWMYSFSPLPQPGHLDLQSSDRKAVHRSRLYLWCNAHFPGTPGKFCSPCRSSRHQQISPSYSTIRVGFILNPTLRENEKRKRWSKTFLLKNIKQEKEMSFCRQDI